MKATSSNKAKRPARAKSTLKKERGVWVHQVVGRDKASSKLLLKQLDAVRKQRIRDLSK
jgi:hypothetical protein